MAIPFVAAEGDQVSSLRDWLDPLIGRPLARLRWRVDKVIRAHQAAPVDLETIAHLLLADLPEQLCAMMSRTLVLELNVARLEARLDGATPAERFASFSQRLRRPDVGRAILREYPVLARQLMIRLDQWAACTLEFVRRLCTDWGLITATFTRDHDPGVLRHLETDAGDRHRRGRSVLIATFTSGFQLVYKPKSMAVDRHFQDLLTWMNQRGTQPAFRTVRILDRQSYGWREFVAAETCDSPAAVRRFYERQGAFLALLHGFGATDFHCDNVIAAGEYPVLIDLEALLQPEVLTEQTTERAAVGAVLERSVLRIGLLPERSWSSAESPGVDMSGLGGAPGQIAPYGVPGWEKEGTDEMHLVRRKVQMSGGSNLPTLNGRAVDPIDYMAEIDAGFTGTYRLMMQHRQALLSPGGPLAWFANDEVRVIVRPTRTYAVLLDESFHPDVLRDARDRDRLFDGLWVGVARNPRLAELVQTEREDLEHGDIPIFTARPRSRDLWTSSGRRIASFFDERPLALVERRLRGFSDRDLALQRWLIQATLATTAPPNLGHIETVQPAASSLDGLQDPVDHAQLLGAARAMGDRLESAAIRTDHEASWIGLTLERDDCWSVGPLTADLYDGLPGVALFLAYLGAMTGEQRYTELAHGACTALRRQIKEDKSYLTFIGAFSGWGGIVYVLAHLAALWHEPDLLSEADVVVGLIRGLVERDQQLDIVAGAAGCIGALIALYQQRPAPDTFAAATECGAHLIRKAQRTAHGVGWTIAEQGRPLAGFAHGAAGFAWALLKLAALTRSERFHTTALAAIAHERSLYSPHERNWRDLRDGTMNEASFMTAWCSGAPGIGLARLSTLGQLDDPEVRREIDAAVQTTLDHGFGVSQSLCHGDLGNLEVLLQAGLVLSHEPWHAKAYQLAQPIVERIGRSEYRCGTPLGVDSPGLMTGLAGIGYGLLRLAEPERVPALLTLEPPTANRYENL